MNNEDHVCRCDNKNMYCIQDIHNCYCLFKRLVLIFGCVHLCVSVGGHFHMSTVACGGFGSPVAEVTGYSKPLCMGAENWQVSCKSRTCSEPWTHRSSFLLISYIELWHARQRILQNSFQVMFPRPVLSMHVLDHRDSLQNNFEKRCYQVVSMPVASEVSSGLDSSSCTWQRQGHYVKTETKFCTHFAAELFACLLLLCFFKLLYLILSCLIELSTILSSWHVCRLIHKRGLLIF
jgi:hypothetical protein